MPSLQTRQRTPHSQSPCRHSARRSKSPGRTADLAATRKPVVVLGGDDDDCWHCGASPTVVSYIIPETQFKRCKRGNLLNIESASHIDNRMSLCDLCDDNLGNFSSPGFCFVPTDIEFFKAHEKMDMLQRIEHYARHRCQITRTCPSSEDYRQHQLSHAIIRPEDPGGLYARYTLEDYFPKLHCCETSRTTRIGELFAPAVWHGDPMAALQRAFALLQDFPDCPIQGMPATVVEQLNELRQLYIDNDAYVESQCRDIEDATSLDQHGRDRRLRRASEEQRSPGDSDDFGVDLRSVSVNSVPPGDDGVPWEVTKKQRRRGYTNDIAEQALRERKKRGKVFKDQ